jgi:hypothetical protein
VCVSLGVFAQGCRVCCVCVCVSESLRKLSRYTPTTKLTVRSLILSSEQAMLMKDLHNFVITMCGVVILADAAFFVREVTFFLASTGLVPDIDWIYLGRPPITTGQRCTRC